MPEKRSRSSKWITTSVHESNTSLKLYLAKYYTNYFLSPVFFAKALNLVPEDAVMIQISPQNILHCVLKKSVTNIPLYTHNNDVEMFLQTIGELYNAGLQPEIANLYLIPKFPVSRGTSMISPFIRYVMHILHMTYNMHIKFHKINTKDTN